MQNLLISKDVRVRLCRPLFVKAFSAEIFCPIKICQKSNDQISCRISYFMQNLLIYWRLGVWSQNCWILERVRGAKYHCRRRSYWRHSDFQHGAGQPCWILC